MRAASLDAVLDWLASSGARRLSLGGLRGFEKECLRVDPNGHLAATPHSPRWGSALTHPHLTTDYSEALLEFVTPPCGDPGSALAVLEELQAFVVKNADRELLWPASMPCIIGVDESVPIAQYGPSNEGRLRSIYRSGLGFRYGRTMQAIAGIHFNFSLPAGFWPAYREFLGTAADLQAFRSDRLMALIRNFRRMGWLVTYLFGASPAFCRSFRPAGHPRLEALGDDTWYGPYATSLRMSDMGYRNSTQARLSIPVNSLEQYLRGLKVALTTREPRYESIGVKVGGEYRQLNANVLQLENEYYSSIRPKPARKVPRLISALGESGVEYVEVRTLDLDPFEPLGVGLRQACFVELLLVYCLVAASPPISEEEQAEINQRELTVAWEGRKPELVVERAGAPVALREWALEIVGALARLADVVDDGTGAYAEAISRAREAVGDPARTLSGRVLADIGSGTSSFFEWAYEIAVRQKGHFLDFEFPAGRERELEAEARQSLETARALEAGPEPPFDEFLEAYLASGLGETGA